MIRAALDLIAQRGVEGFSLRDCATKAGVSIAAPYRHFKDKDDLLAGVATDCIQRLGTAMDHAVATAGATDPLSVFRATGIAYVRFAVEHPAHFRVMHLPQVVARMPEETSAAAAAWAYDMTTKLEGAQLDGLLTNEMPLADLLLAARALTHGLAHMIVDDVDGLGKLSADDAAKLAVDITGVLGFGLLPRAGSATSPGAAATRGAPRSRRRADAGARTARTRVRTSDT